MSDEGPLSRWSRLKGRARTAERRDRGAAAPKPDPEALPVPAAVPAAAEAPAAPVPAEDLPPIDTLGRESDYTPFLRPGVPPELKRAALAKLWRSDPIIAHPDNLDDFGDFSTFTPIDSMKDTIYRVGRGLVDPAEETRETAAAEAAPAPEPDPGTGSDGADAAAEEDDPRPPARPPTRSEPD